MTMGLDACSCGDPHIAKEHPVNNPDLLDVSLRWEYHKAGLVVSLTGEIHIRSIERPGTRLGVALGRKVVAKDNQSNRFAKVVPGARGVVYEIKDPSKDLYYLRIFWYQARGGIEFSSAALEDVELE